MSTPAVTLIIAEIAHPLRWNLAAHYRLQGLANPPAIAALTDPARSMRAMFDFAWAMLPESAGYVTPADLVEALDADDEALARVASAIGAAFEAAAETKAKKAAPSSSPTPA
jgi:hypothetical protein